MLCAFRNARIFMHSLLVKPKLHRQKRPRLDMHKTIEERLRIMLLPAEHAHDDYINHHNHDDHYSASMHHMPGRQTMRLQFQRY